MKTAADVTLSEVRKKLSEARKCKEVLDRLTKLRQVRKDAMERMGKSSTNLLLVPFRFAYFASKRHAQLT